jgi:Glycoside hydrolase family 44
MITTRTSCTVLLRSSAVAALLWLACGIPSVAWVADATPDNPDIKVTVFPTRTHKISPYIYGINSAASVTALPAGLTLDRAGGNRWTTYNWVTNASNAGKDYLYENDNFLSGSHAPAAAVTDFIARAETAGMASLITFQLQGLVAGDEDGPVHIDNPSQRSRFKRVIFQKSSASRSAFTVTPATDDEAVFMDEFIWAIDQKFSNQKLFSTTPKAPPVFAELDNEPELWSSTHLEVQGAKPVDPDLFVTKSIALSSALKAQFPDLVVFGPANYGFYGMYSWNGQVQGVSPSGNNWFVDKYLRSIRTAAARFGRPLVDVYDIHWYPEATDGSGARITNLNSPSLTDAQIEAIVQSPRSLWDSTYTENSWIAGALGGPVEILKRLQTRINSENPGMRLAITEYNNGGAQHIAGTIAEADNLGVFAAQELFAANLWPLGSSPYIVAGFRAYRNFDGAHHNFGDISVDTVSSDAARATAYVSKDSARPNRVVVVVINRSARPLLVSIDGQPLSGTAHMFQMTATSARSQSTIVPVPAGAALCTADSLRIQLPALSVTTVDIY